MTPMNRLLCIYILLILGVPCLAQQTKENSTYAWLPLFEQLCDYDDIEEHDMEDMSNNSANSNRHRST